MDTTAPLPLIVGALPAIAALVKVIWPTGDRGLHHKLRRLGETLEKMPEGAGKAALAATADVLGQELAYQESRRARRRLKGSAVAAVILVVLAGAGLSWFLWSLDNVPTRILAVLVAVFASLLVISGLPQVRPVDDKYRFQMTDEK